MNKRAMILHGFVHWIFDAKDYPDEFPPDPEGNPIVIIDLIGENEGAKEGDGWNPLTQTVVPNPNTKVWNTETYTWD